MKVLHRLGEKETLISAGDIDSQSEKDYFLQSFSLQFQK